MTRLVLGVDSSTTATKVIAWDEHGHQHGEGRAAIELFNPQPGYFEQDAYSWWTAFIEATQDLAGQLDLNQAEALAISNQRETVAFLDAAGESVGPAITWMDERCTDGVDDFAAIFGDDEIHRITGKHKDNTPVIYTLAWLKEHQPQLLDAAQQICDVQAYLVQHLTGELATSWSSADPFAYWEMQEMRIAHEVLEPLGISAERLPKVHAPGSVLGTIKEDVAATCGLPVGIKVVAGGGDGQCAGLGAGVVKPGVAYLNLGTAVVCGAYSDDYTYGNAWRTLTSMSAQGYINESVLVTGTFLTNWLVKNIFGLEGTVTDYAELEQRASQLAPGADGLRLLPYWLGVRNPYWDPQARGAIFGLAGHHGREHLYRATLEGIALEEAFCFEHIAAATGVKLHTYFAVGGGSNSDLWCQICADCFNANVCRLETAEASALGAGMAAAVGAGIHPDLVSAAEKMGAKVSETYTPGPDQAAYAALIADHAKLYPATNQLS